MGTAFLIAMSKELSPYAKKLRSPKWQKMRLQILERDKFTCRHCGETEKPLHVHHCFYNKGAQPWDYESGTLVTLCEDCHEAVEARNKQLLQASGESRIIGIQAIRFVSGLTAVPPYDMPPISWLCEEVGAAIASCEGICSCLQEKNYEGAYADMERLNAATLEIMSSLAKLRDHMQSQIIDAQ